MDAQLADLQQDALDEGEGFDLANVQPARTGLPMVIWISDGTGVRHDLRVKVSQEHGPRIRTRDWAVMSVRPEPRLIHGELSGRDVEAVARWIRLNEPLIVDYWEGRLFTDDMLTRVQRV